MIPNDNIQHVFPLDDLEEHLLETEETGDLDIINGCVQKIISCNCKCEPEIQYLENSCAIVVHNSFDGREGVEWANEVILKPK